MCSTPLPTQVGEATAAAVTKACIATLKKRALDAHLAGDMNQLPTGGALETPFATLIKDWGGSGTCSV